MPAAYNWKLVTALHSGHRIFLDENTRKLAIADNSGPTPDTTDDGVLWLAEEEEVALTLFDGKLWASVAVDVAGPGRRRDRWVMCDFASVPQLAGLGLKLGCSERFGQHMDLWRQVIALFDAQTVEV